VNTQSVPTRHFPLILPRNKAQSKVFTISRRVGCLICPRASIQPFEIVRSLTSKMSKRNQFLSLAPRFHGYSDIKGPSHMLKPRLTPPQNISPSSNLQQASQSLGIGSEQDSRPLYPPPSTSQRLRQCPANSTAKRLHFQNGTNSSRSGGLSAVNRGRRLLLH
jgi:hypothetical protein